MDTIKHLEQKFSIASYELIKTCHPLELKFYLWLKLWAINKNAAWPSYETICDELKISSSTLRDLIVKMQAVGRLKVRKTTGQNNVYDITTYDLLAAGRLSTTEPILNHIELGKYRDELILAQNNQCAYCEIQFFVGIAKNKDQKDRWAEVDHIIPVSKGGLSNKSNLVIACHKCNSTKSDKIWSPKLSTTTFDFKVTTSKIEVPTTSKIEVKLSESKRIENNDRPYLRRFVEPDEKRADYNSPVLKAMRKKYGKKKQGSIDVD